MNESEADKILDEYLGIKPETPETVTPEMTEKIQPASTESILKYYIIRDNAWSEIGKTSKLLLENYKKAVLALAVVGQIDSISANRLIESCDTMIKIIYGMEVEK